MFNSVRFTPWIFPVDVLIEVKVESVCTITLEPCPTYLR